MAAEKNFENNVKAFLVEQGAWFIKYWAGSRFTKDGIPDLLCCINGYFVAPELKAENGEPSKLQLYHIAKIREAGGFSMVLYPSAFDRFKEFVIDLKHEKFERESEIIWK